MAHVTLFNGMDMDGFQESDLDGSSVTEFGPTVVTYAWNANHYFLRITGFGLTYGGANGVLLTGGTAQGLELVGPYGRALITGFNTDASILGQAYLNSDPSLALGSILSGDDVIEETPSPGAIDDSFLARGFNGNDLMKGGGARSVFYGGDGNDTLQGLGGDGNYLRGDAGNDSITGADHFDDINGNMGDDTAGGGGGDDWVVGGKDNDLLFGDDGADIVYGNLGNDTCDGGAGADLIRGGQGNDVLNGGSGDDWLSGDRGDDTMAGGAGADVFHGSQDAGIDRVVDFSYAAGDRVRLDAGTTYSVSQVGADTVIDMGGGHKMILVGVQFSTLAPGWIT